VHCRPTGKAEIAKLLLDHGLDVNVTDGEGRTPLHLAAAKGHDRVVRLLLNQESINVQARDRYRCPIHHIIQGIDRNRSKLLRKNFLDILHRLVVMDLDGHPTLHRSGNRWQSHYSKYQQLSRLFDRQLESITSTILQPTVLKTTASP
jgi:ankyrin repeat protein